MIWKFQLSIFNLIHRLGRNAHKYDKAIILRWHKIPYEAQNMHKIHNPYIITKSLSL